MKTQPMVGLTMNPPTKLSRGRDPKEKPPEEKEPAKEETPEKPAEEPPREAQ